jgi:hypothetical protein
LARPPRDAVRARDCAWAVVVGNGGGDGSTVSPRHDAEVDQNSNPHHSFRKR